LGRLQTADGTDPVAVVIGKVESPAHSHLQDSPFGQRYNFSPDLSDALNPASQIEEAREAVILV
jgi:hypothetical protein